MPKRPIRKKTKLSLASPIYFITQGGGSGVRLVLTNGKWVFARLTSRMIDKIQAAPPCSQLKSGACGGRCPTGKSCSTLLIASFERVPIPEIPRGRPGRDYVIKSFKKSCVCL